MIKLKNSALIIVSSFIFLGCNMPHPPIPIENSMTTKEREKLLVFLKTESQLTIEKINNYLEMEPDKVEPRVKGISIVGGDYSNEDSVAFVFLPTDGSWVDYSYNLYTAKYYEGFIDSAFLIVSKNKDSNEIRWNLQDWHPN